MPTRPELQVPDTLPGAGIQASVGDRDGDGGADQGGFDMSLPGRTISIFLTPP